MSTALGSVSLWNGASLVATLTRARLADLSLTSDQTAFRAPFGTRWHHTQARPRPALQELSGVISNPSLAAVQTALAAVTHLGVGAWRMPVMGASGPVIVVPVLGGQRITARFVIDPAAPWEPDP